MKNYFLIKITQVILLLVIAIKVPAQTGSPADSAGNFSNDKIYIHYDKPYYASGETIWFKAYLYSNRLPSVNNNNFYLQLLDPKGKIIDAKKYPISGATVKGNINIGEGFEEGYYTIRAVTPATVNDNEFIYTKNLYIYNLAVKPIVNTISKKINIQFFPESGNLIDSIFTDIGFKATDEFGNPVGVKGVIRTSNDAIAAQFKSTHNGMGRFTFKPRLEQKYFAETDFNGQIFTFPLPPVQQTGIYLRVADEENGKVYELARNKKTLSENVNLIVRLNKHVVFESQIDFNNELILRGHLNTKNLPSGILQFTVLNKEGLPLAERLTFVNNSEYKLDPLLKVSQLNTEKRGKNNWVLQLPADIQTSLSVSITDAAAQEFPDKENIYSRLLLTADLKGYIYNPAWYFQNNDPATKEALDNVMMIHGWSRYNIKKNTASVNQKLHDEYLLTVTGVVNDVKTGKPVSKGLLNFGIVSEDSTVQQVKIPVDNKGRFILDSLLIFGKAKLYYTYNNDAGKENKVIIMADRIAKDSVYYPQNISERSTLLAQFKQIYQQLDFSIPVDEKIKLHPEVVIQQKAVRPTEKVNDRYTTSLFKSSGRIILDNINHPYMESNLSVIDYIKMNITGLQFNGSGFVNRKNFSLGSGNMWRVETLLNEFPVAVATISPIRMRDVALIKFYEAGFTGAGSGGPGGAIAIYLKKDEDGVPTILENEAIKYLTIESYSVTKEFYNPDYSVPDPRHAAADRRIILYWNPDANTSSVVPVNINFYNNDFSKKFNVVIEGFDNTGKLIHYEKTIGN